MQWRVIAGHPRYEINLAAEIRNDKGKVMAQQANEQGYLKFSPYTDGRYHTVFIHRALAEAFIGPSPFPGAVVRHLNDDKLDNRIENLAWGTHQQNIDDQIRNGKHRRYRTTGCTRGHEFTPDNTYTAPSGKRHCRICARRMDRERYARGKVVTG